MSKHYRPGQLESILETARQKGMIPEASSHPRNRSTLAQDAFLSSGKVKTADKRKKTGVEAEFELILRKQKQDGEILAYGYIGSNDGIKFDVGEPNCTYTPDFIVILYNFALRFIETKGDYIYPDALIKFKAAKKQYPAFEWELHQKIKGVGWKRIH